MTHGVGGVVRQHGRAIPSLLGRSYLGPLTRGTDLSREISCVCRRDRVRVLVSDLGSSRALALAHGPDSLYGLFEDHGSNGTLGPVEGKLQYRHGYRAK